MRNRDWLRNLARLGVVVITTLASCSQNKDSGAPPFSSGGSGGGSAGSAESGASGGEATATGAGTASTTGVIIDLSDASVRTEDGAAVTSLSISPATAVFDVTTVNGSVQSVSAGDAGEAAVRFETTANGAPVSTATWSIDRGELGALDVSSGTFAPNGLFGGTAVVTATYGGATATAKIVIRLHMIQNGGSASLDGGVAEAGAGGVGGVGGEGPGQPVDDSTRTRLGGAATSPASASELGILYPYDKTVWPRGLLPPLVQWQTTHRAAAVYIHLTEQNFEFEGFYAGTNLTHQPIDPVAWRAALNGNGGDTLHLELKIADASAVYGPVAEDWIVAPGILRGTVYYDSYSTRLATPQAGSSSAAAILAIRPGMTDPVLALPGSGNKCIVCHTVSDDGSTLFAQITNQADPTAEDYSNGASYDLRNNGAAIASYTGNAPDGTTNNRKFLWSGVWKDGTFALQSVGHTQEAYGGNAATGALSSRIFRRDDGNGAAAAGLDGVVKEAVTPAFSRDGARVAFNYWTGTAAPGGGNGHTLDLMDFACNPPTAATPGSPSCTTFSFSGLRRLYTNTDSQSGFVGWPAWLPDSSGLVFHNTTALSSNYAEGDSPISTWHGAKAQIWFVDVPADASTAPTPIPLFALNGDASNGSSNLPTQNGVVGHEDDDHMNYEPTVNPIPSGGYSWVVFTSRRAYGNVAQGNPYAAPDGSTPVPKKLWVAAIDLHPKPGQDPSHPAFYLPGQELLAGNMRGYWVVDPCRTDGASCETGDECCGGYCRPNGQGMLVCGQPPGGCAQEFEKCTTSAECCGAGQGYSCINGVCSRPAIMVH